jgi:hypothetical protein
MPHNFFDQNKPAVHEFRDGRFFREMSIAARADMEELSGVESKSAKQLLDMRWIAVLDTACDADGKRILTAGDRDQFKAMPAAEVDAIFEFILETSGLADEEDIAAAREEFEGN